MMLHKKTNDGILRDAQKQNISSNLGRSKAVGGKKLCTNTTSKGIPLGSSFIVNDLLFYKATGFKYLYFVIFC